MPTLYIDVYFLINFTVDILAFYFASLFAKVDVTAKRLVISGLIGAVFASLTVLFNVKGFLFFILLVLSAALMTICVGGAVSALRKVKLFGAFIIFETFIGGFVLFAYNALNKYLLPLISSTEFGAENKKILLLSLIVLLSIGVLKLLFSMYGGSISQMCVSVEITLFGRSAEVSAMVDSGNLVKDPLTMTPVIIVKESAISQLCISLNEADATESDNYELKKRLRIIPISGLGTERILYAVRPDRVCVRSSGKSEDVKAVVAIDNEVGNFGGYDALIPASLLEGVL